MCARIGLANILVFVPTSLVISCLVGLTSMILTKALRVLEIGVSWPVAHGEVHHLVFSLAIHLPGVKCCSNGLRSIPLVRLRVLHCGTWQPVMRSTDYGQEEVLRAKSISFWKIALLLALTALYQGSV